MALIKVHTVFISGILNKYFTQANNEESVIYFCIVIEENSKALDYLQLAIILYSRVGGGKISYKLTKE